MEPFNPPQLENGPDGEFNSGGDVCSVNLSDFNSSVGIVAPAIESSSDTGEATDDPFGLTLRFDRPKGLVREVEDDGLPMVATARVNSGKTQGPHKEIETEAPAWLRAVARACAAIFVVSSDFDNLFNVVEEDEENWGTQFRANNPDRLPHLQHTVRLWHDIRSPVV